MQVSSTKKKELGPKSPKEVVWGGFSRLIQVIVMIADLC